MPCAAAATAATIGSSGSSGFSFEASLIASVIPCSCSACLAPLPGWYVGSAAINGRGRPIVSSVTGAPYPTDWYRRIDARRPIDARGQIDAHGQAAMRTAITDKFGIDLPILAFTHCRDVVVAVTKAGGMGVLGAAAHSERQLEIDLDWIETEIGDRPYGVDLIVPAKYAGSDEGGLTPTALRDMIPAGHRAFVDEILDRYGVPELPADSGRGGLIGGSEAAPFSA